MFRLDDLEKLNSKQFTSLKNFSGTIILPINVGLRSQHWTFAVLPAKSLPQEIAYYDPLKGKPDVHARKVIEVVHYIT